MYAKKNFPLEFFWKYNNLLFHPKQKRNPKYFLLQKNNNIRMRKVLAILSINPEYVEFALPELKSILSPLKIPFSTLFSESMPLPQNHYEINHRTVKNFPYVTLTVPDFDDHREYFEMASKRAVMVSKFVLLISQGKNYQELLSDPDQEILNMQCRDWNQLVVCDFISRNRVVQREDQIKKIHEIFDKMDIRGKIDLKNAKKRMQLIQQHSWYTGHHETDINQTLEKVFFGIELSTCKQGKAKFNINYQLSQRIYLGPTSADNDLAFLMCNQGQIGPGSLVLDPFVGTGGLLIPPATQGSMVFGSDLDMRVLNGYAVGRINKKSPYYSVDKELETFVPKIYLSFDQYGLPRPNILRMDSTKGGFARHVKFDAIITDPPYGIRAMSRSMKKKDTPDIVMAEPETNIENSELQVKINKEEQEKESSAIAEIKEEDIEKSEEELAFQQKKKQRREKRKQEKQKKLEEMSEEQKLFKKNIADKLSKDRREKWEKFDIAKVELTARESIFEGLLNLARKHLKIGGRLVFLYPIYEEEKFIGLQNLPPHEGFNVIDMSQNVLSSKNSRILVTMEKLKQE